MSETESIVEKEAGSSQSESPMRFRKAVDALSKTVVSSIEEVGFDKLQNVPRGSIFAVDHTRDVYVPMLASILGSRRDVAVTHISAQDMKNDPATKIGMSLAGSENFLPISYDKVDGNWQPKALNANDFRHIAEVASKGKDIIIASGNPPTTGRAGRPGLAPVLTAQELLKSGKAAVVVPVTFMMEANDEVGNAGIKSYLETVKHRFSKPKATAIMGEPIKLDQVDMSAYDIAMEKRAKGEVVTADELDAFHSVKLKLQEQSQKIVDAQQSLLEETKSDHISD